MEDKYNEIPLEEFENDKQDIRSEFLKKFSKSEEIKKGNDDQELTILKGCLMLFPKINLDKWKQAIEALIPKDITIEYELDPHVTILYGFDDAVINLERLKELVTSYIRRNPLDIALGEISYFRNDERDVIKIGIRDKNGHLNGLNSFIRNNFTYENNFDYNPHFTLAYVARGEGDNFVGRHVDLDEFGFLTLSTGNFIYSNSNKEKTQITSTLAEE